MIKKIVYTCPYIPAELIAAYGLQPSRIIPDSGGIDSIISGVEGFCPYVKGFINYLSAEKDYCGIVVTTVCDQMRRGFDIIVHQFNNPCFLMNVPSTWQTLSSQKLYLDELKRLGRFLIRLGGKEPANDSLSEIMFEYDTARKILLESRDDLSAVQFAEAIAEFGRNGPNRHIYNFTQSNYHLTGVPLAIIGGPMTRECYKNLDLIEQSGGRIVFNATETGERGLCTPFDRRNLRENPLMELANAYFYGIQDASRRPNSELYKWLKQELIARKVRGIIFHRNLWCDIWHAELQRLKDWAGLPVLDIDSTGDGELSLNRNQNRIRAFLEMLQ
jgi:benzoyl-CoA reductase/2-hydroxyglutaryl-CoA dehydratase subunit BcrC/BadD/HgdB